MSDEEHEQSGSSGGGGGDDGYDDQSDYTNGSGPSRKRSRVTEHTAQTLDYKHTPHASQVRAPVASTSRPRPVPVSMFGIDARNDLVREIGEWLVNTCHGLQDIEVGQMLSVSLLGSN